MSEIDSAPCTVCKREVWGKAPMAKRSTVTCWSCGEDMPLTKENNDAVRQWLKEMSE